MDKEPQTERKEFFYCYNMIFKLDLSIHAKIIYVFLCRLSDKRGRCYPSMEHIGEACSIKSRTTINTALKELEKIGLLNKNNRRRITGGNTSNEYFIYDCPKK